MVLNRKNTVLLSWDSAVGIATDYGLNDRVVSSSPGGFKNFLLQFLRYTEFWFRAQQIRSEILDERGNDCKKYSMS
jgi:hypothetical protein